MAKGKGTGSDRARDTVTVQFLVTTHGYQRGEVATITLDERADGLLRSNKVQLVEESG